MSFFSRTLEPIEQDKLASVCAQGDLNAVKQCLQEVGLIKSKSVFQSFFNMLSGFSSSNDLLQVQECMNKALFAASGEGHVDVVQYLLISPDIKVKPRIDDFTHDSLKMSIFKGHLPVMACLLSHLSSNALNGKEVSQRYYNNAFFDACKSGQLNVVQHLLSSQESSYHANIHSNDDSGLMSASFYGHLDVVKYLLTSPELTQHACLDEDNGMALRRAHTKGHHHIVTFLLYDMNMQVPQECYDSIQDKEEKHDLTRLVAKRDLFFKMNQDMEETTVSPETRRKKI